MSPEKVHGGREWSPAKVQRSSSDAPEGVQKSNVPYRGTGLDSWTDAELTPPASARALVLKGRTVTPSDCHEWVVGAISARSRSDAAWPRSWRIMRSGRFDHA